MVPTRIRFLVDPLLSVSQKSDLAVGGGKDAPNTVFMKGVGRFSLLKFLFQCQ